MGGTEGAEGQYLRCCFSGLWNAPGSFISWQEGPLVTASRDHQGPRLSRGDAVYQTVMGEQGAQRKCQSQAWPRDPQKASPTPQQSHRSLPAGFEGSRDEDGEAEGGLLGREKSLNWGRCL